MRNWRLQVEKKLDALADVLARNLEEPWEAEVHKHVVEAWVMLRDYRQGENHRLENWSSLEEKLFGLIWNHQKSPHDPFWWCLDENLRQVFRRTLTMQLRRRDPNLPPSKDE